MGNILTISGFIFLNIIIFNVQASNNGNKYTDDIIVMSYKKEFGDRFGATVNSIGTPSGDIQAFVFKIPKSNKAKSCSLDVYLSSNIEIDYPEGEIGYRIANPEYFSKLSKWERDDDKKSHIDKLLRYSRMSGFYLYDKELKKYLSLGSATINKYRKYLFNDLSFIEFEIPTCKFKSARNIPFSQLWLKKISAPSGKNYRKIREYDEVDFIKYTIPEEFGKKVVDILDQR